MTRRLLPAALAGACLLAALAPPALAGPSFQLAADAKFVDGLVDPGGTLHAVWTDDVSPENNVVHYCQVPRGATACANARNVALPIVTDQIDEPFLVREPDGTLHIAMGRYVESDAFIWTSENGGANWTTAIKVYDRQPCTDATEPLLGPLGGEITFVSWNVGKCIFGAAIDGGEQGEQLVADPPGGGDYDFAAAPTEDGGLIAAANDLHDSFAWYLPPGGNPSVTAGWGGARPLGPGADTNVAGGPGGAYVLNQERLADFSDQIHVRRWEGAGFSPLVDVGSRETGYVHDITVGPSGQIAAAWRRNAQDGEGFRRLRIARSTNQGASFSAPVSFTTTTSLASRLDVGLASNGGGFAVWQDEGQTVRAASLDPIAEFVAPAAPGPGPAPGGGGTPTPTAPKPAARAVTRTVLVKGARVTLTGPKGCILPRGTFVATLKWKRQKRKGNLFVKIRRTDFYLGTRRVKIDRKAPFRQTLRVRATSVRGSAIRLRARAFIKVKRGRSPKKSLFVTFRVCP